MTVRLTPADVAGIVEGAAAAGMVVAALVAVLAVYLLVRPPRRRRQPAEEEAIEGEELRALVDRMERRLAVLERAIADGDSAAPRPRREQLIDAGETARGMRRER